MHEWIIQCRGMRLDVEDGKETAEAEAAGDTGNVTDEAKDSAEETTEETTGEAEDGAEEGAEERTAENVSGWWDRAVDCAYPTVPRRATTSPPVAEPTTPRAESRPVKTSYRKLSVKIREAGGK